MIYQAIIIGGGPSGLMAAIELENQDINYLLLEKNEKVGKKLFLSGGKRCNVTNNLDIDGFIENLTLKNKRFLYPSLYTMSPDQVIDFFKENNLKLVLENNFKYFPKTNKSQSVIDVLLSNIDSKNIGSNVNVTSIERDGNNFVVHTNKGDFQSSNVIVATGSKSFPITGSTGFGLQVASKFELEFDDFIPAETHIYSNQVKSKLTDLMGTSIENTTVKIKNSKIKHTGDLLFTHFGLSGPVIYHLSEFIYESLKKGDVILEFPITSMQDAQILDILSQANKTVLRSLETIVTKRLARKVLSLLKMENKNNSELSKRDSEKIRDMLLRFTVKVTKVEDREKAYVNKGGVLLKELNPSSLECKKVPGLYFTGETINIHGPIGGYNITIAFATGKLAALDICSKYKN